ncbi:hypothetical protein PQ462_20480 [Flavobacterium sp. KACC 22758]|uniref:glycosyltransferase n=1 Tax=Flavobacterium sp. KACC 22758 TaxID=3025667 RepID=UPI002366700E|nr:hypothetical protein [Flavobacterium sp. KACC 22758]WDF59079.1 hypothetical protein PQ462_20480 [Flavobacterium sp. KACC 22758]
MSVKVYVYGLCNVFYDGYYIFGIKKVYKNYKFNVSKFPDLSQGTFAFIVEEGSNFKKIIIDSGDASTIDLKALDWCDIYGKVNYNSNNIETGNQGKIISIGPSFGVKIWNLFQTFYHLTLNYFRFRKQISNAKEFAVNYWRQLKRLKLREYVPSESSRSDVFFINSIWKKESNTNANRAMFIQCCKSNSNIHFEGGFAPRSNGDNLGYDHLIYPKKVPLEIYIKKNKKAAFVFNTPAVLSCHGWKLAEFLALGKAIISTHHYNKLPAELIHNHHLIYAENTEEINLAIDKIIGNHDFKQMLETQSKKYFDDYLAPEKVVKRLIEKK